MTELDNLETLIKELELKRNELKTVEKSKFDYEHIVDSMPVCVCLVSTEKKIMKANKEFAALFNKHPKSTVGLTCDTVFNGKECPFKTSLICDAESKMKMKYIRQMRKWYIILTCPVHDREDGLYGYSHVVINVLDKIE